MTVGDPLVPEAVNPNVVEPPPAKVRFQSAFLAVMLAPDAVKVPFHRLLMALPLPSVHLAVQPLMLEELGLLTVTSAWKPPDQELMVR